MGLLTFVAKSFTLWIMLRIVKCQDNPNHLFTPLKPSFAGVVPLFQSPGLTLKNNQFYLQDEGTSASTRNHAQLSPIISDRSRHLPGSRLKSSTEPLNLRLDVDVDGRKIDGFSRQDNISSGNSSSTYFPTNHPQMNNRQTSKSNQLRIQQHIPFRSTRTRYQTSLDTKTPNISRYNRFEFKRLPFALEKNVHQSPLTHSMTSKLPFLTANKTILSPPRPVFISREINQPFNFTSERSVRNLNKSYDEDEFYEKKNYASSRIRDLALKNNDSKELAIPTTSQELSYDLTPTEANNEKAQDDHTVIITSNFYLPDSIEESNEEEYDKRKKSDSNAKPRSKEANNETISTTTEKTLDYDYDSYENGGMVTTQTPPEHLYEEQDHFTELTTEFGADIETSSHNAKTSKLSDAQTELSQESTELTISTVITSTDLTTEPSLSYDYYGDEIDEDVLGSGEDKSGGSDMEQNKQLNRTNIIGREIVSVVTTKSVINGSTALPQPIMSSINTSNDNLFHLDIKQDTKTIEDVGESKTKQLKAESAEELNINKSTESYVVIASIQTSRSINGARFLPFPAIEQEETKQTLSELERKIHGKSSQKRPYELELENEEKILSMETSSSITEGTSSQYVSDISKIEETLKKQAHPTPLMASKFSPNIRKFTPKTTSKQRINIDEIPMDDLTGLLPVGFKPRPSYKSKMTTYFSSTTHRPQLESQNKSPRNTTLSHSYKKPLYISKNAVSPTPIAIAKDNTLNSVLHISELPSLTHEENVSLNKEINNLDKPFLADENKKNNRKNQKKNIDDISQFLPVEFKRNFSTNKPSFDEQRVLASLLPPGFKSAGGEKIEFRTIKDVNELLPPDNRSTLAKTLSSTNSLQKQIRPNHPEENISAIETTTAQIPFYRFTTNSGLKIVFPKSINKRPGQRLTTPSLISGEPAGPTIPTITIKKGPPVRSSTEFTGWPMPSTTPISIEKLLEHAKTATIETLQSPLPTADASDTTLSSTTPINPEPPRPTKPGYCKSECDLAGTIKIIDGVIWKPELLDHNTLEWKNLAREIEYQLNEVYSIAPHLCRWFKKVRIDSFSKGSVLVDYFVELGNITKEVDTLYVKKLFHQALSQPPLPVVPLSTSNESKLENSGNTIKNFFLMGRFSVDPESTDFIVIPRSHSPTVEFAQDDVLIPHWAIVLIVIGVGSLCFVIIFGVTVLLNRQKRAKKTPIPLTIDMMNDLKVSHMGGADNYGVDDFYNIDDAWHDTKQSTKPKRFISTVNGSCPSNIYDSWRSSSHGDQSHNYTPHGLYPPDTFVDAHQMYTYNNHKSKYQKEYDPDF